jgi:Flp pilus assembly pilin Flp
MATTNDFIPFAIGSGANVETQAAWAAEATLLANGFQSGVAPSAKFNKALRQSSIMAAVLAQFIADESGQNSVDDGTLATLIANMKAGVNAMIAAGSATPFASNTEAQALTSTTKAISPSTLAQAFKGSNQSLAANGYQILPGGTIIQYGSGVAAGVTATITLPLTFPTACRSVLLTTYNNNGSVDDICELISMSAASFVAFCKYTPGNFSWLAIGY